MRGILCPVSAASVEYRRYTMKLIRSLILLVMAVLLCGSAFAEQPQASTHKAQTSIIIDGVLDEWVLDSPMILNSEEQLIRDAQTWHGKEDLSCVTCYYSQFCKNKNLGSQNGRRVWLKAERR